MRLNLSESLVRSSAAVHSASSQSWNYWTRGQSTAITTPNRRALQSPGLGWRSTQQRGARYGARQLAARGIFPGEETKGKDQYGTGTESVPQALGPEKPASEEIHAAVDGEQGVSGGKTVPQKAWPAKPEKILEMLTEEHFNETSFQEQFFPTSTKYNDKFPDGLSERATLRRQQAIQDKLEKELRFVAHQRPQIHVVQSILKILFERYAVKPTILHYEAMILANCDAENGSVATVKALLDEMEQEGIQVGASIYYAVIKVLAIHPDYIFRNQVRSQMKREWIAQTVISHHHVIAGLIRDGQLELAMQRIIQSQPRQYQSIDFDPWLYATLLHALCAASDFPAVQQFLYVLEDHRIKLSPLTWLLVLEAASKYLDLSIVKYIWLRQVEPEYINPPTGMCMEALLVASREGDIGLAELVVEVLARKESGGAVGLSEPVWEMLSEAYESAGDQQGAEDARTRRISLLTESTTSHTGYLARLRATSPAQHAQYEHEFEKLTIKKVESVPKVRPRQARPTTLEVDKPADAVSKPSKGMEQLLKAVEQREEALKKTSL